MSHTASHPIFALTGQLVARVWRVFQNRKSAAELSGWTDEQLKDIGLTRSDVRQAFALPIHTDPTSVLSSLASGHSATAISPLAANSGVYPARPSLAPIPGPHEQAA